MVGFMICDSTISEAQPNLNTDMATKYKPNGMRIHIYPLQIASCNPYSANQIDDSSQIPITKGLIL